MSISVRALGKKDWEAFAAIRLRALKECPGVFSSNHAKESKQNTQEWQEWLTQKGKCLFGLFDDKELIGIAGIFTHKQDPLGETGVLGADYIRPDYRGKGLAGKLYNARLNWAKDYLAWKRAVISHRLSNEASRRSNQQWGFRYTHTDKGKIWPDGGTEDELWYELDLEQLRKKK